MLSSNPAVKEALSAFDQAIETQAEAAGIEEDAVMDTFFRSEYLQQPEMNDAGDGTEYSRVHSEYHTLFKNYLEEYGYYDIFLVEPHSGVIIYSVYKETDFGTSLLTGPYKDTNIAAAYLDALQASSEDFVTLEDFAYYEPSDGAASFVASPIFVQDELAGVLLFQLPIDQINAVMQEQAGMGETGETYLVGSDLLMRSDSRFSDESTIFVQEIDTVSANKALNGEEGFDIIEDYRGVSVLSSYAKLDISHVDWAILAEIDEVEAFAPARQQLTMTILSVTVIGVIVVVIAIVISNGITKPILLITEGAPGVFRLAILI